MSTNRDEERELILIRKARRGGRIRAVRVALRLTGEQFAERLVRLSAERGSPAAYDKSVVAKLEGGTRDPSAEEAELIAALDPEKRGVTWLVWGSAEQVAEIPDPKTDRKLTGEEIARAQRQAAAERQSQARGGKGGRKRA